MLITVSPSPKIHIKLSIGLTILVIPLLSPGKVGNVPGHKSIHDPGLDRSVIGVASGSQTSKDENRAVGGGKTLTGGSAVTGIQLFPSTTSTEILYTPQLSSYTQKALASVLLLSE